MELVLAPMLRSMQTCISQQQLQKQFGHLGNSVYHLQLPSQGSASQSVAQPMAQPMAQLTTSMAQLLDVPGGDVGGLAPQASGVSSMGSQSWDPSASLHLHQSLLQQQQQLQQQIPLQSQGQQPPSQAQPQTQPSYQMQQQPQVQSVAQQQTPQSLSHPSFSLPYQSQPQNPPAQLVSNQQTLTHGPSGYLSEQPQAPTAEHVSVSIISPAIWTPADRPNPELDTSASFGAPTQTAQMANASAPAASHDDLAAAYGSSSFSSSVYPPSQQQQQIQQPSPQQLSEKPLELRPRPPLGGNDSRRSIATNTQLTMHRGNSDAQRSGAAQASTGSSLAALLPSADSGWGQAQAGLYQAAQGSAGPLVAGQPFLHSQPVLRSSDSTGSLTAPVEALEGRSSGQMPMRAGSPALGGRASPKPPSWSSHMHDPFGELVTQDLKCIGSSSSNIT